MIIFSCSSLLFLTALAVKGNSSWPQPNQSLSSLTASSKCHNVHFNNYYSVPGKDDIKAQLSRIENRLEYIERKIDSLNIKNNTRGSSKVRLLSGLIVAALAASYSNDLFCFVRLSVKKVYRKQIIIPFWKCRINEMSASNCKHSTIPFNCLIRNQSFHPLSQKKNKKKTDGAGRFSDYLQI